MDPDRAPTIDDVAAAAGVSRSAVSRVLTADTRVSAASRDAVERAIRALSYTPNDAARALARAPRRRTE